MLLAAVCFSQPGTMTLHCDNKGGITMSLHPANKPATGHVRHASSLCRQHTEQGRVHLVFQPTPSMVAVDLTKGQTPRPTHERHALRSMGKPTARYPFPPILRVVEECTLLLA